MRLIQSYAAPDLQAVRLARELEERCKAYDGLKGSLYLDPSLNFSKEIPCLFILLENETPLGVMTFFAPTQEEAEIVGLTRPEYRRSGVFRALTAAAARSAQQFGIPDLLFVAERQSESGVAALARLGVALEYTEFSLRFDRSFDRKELRIPQGLTLRRAKDEDLDAMAHVSAESFHEPQERARHFLSAALASNRRTQFIALLNGEPAGICGVGYEDGEATIYGLGVLPALQGRGIGRGIISLLLKELLADDKTDILIEVNALNASALHLYLSCGFVSETASGYYRARAQRFLSDLAK